MFCGTYPVMPGQACTAITPGFIPSSGEYENCADVTQRPETAPSRTLHDCPPPNQQHQLAQTVFAHTYTGLRRSHSGVGATVMAKSLSVTGHPAVCGTLKSTLVESHVTHR